MMSIGDIFTSTYHTKQLNPWPNSSASCMVNYSWLSPCQGEKKPFEDHPGNHGHLTSLSNKPQHKQPGKIQHQYLPKSLVNVYSYRLIVKSVSCCCVCGRRIFSNLVTSNLLGPCKNYYSYCTHHKNWLKCSIIEIGQLMRASRRTFKTGL